MNLFMSHRNSVYNLPYLLICEKHLLPSLQLFNELFYIVIFIHLSLFKSTKYHFKSIRFIFYVKLTSDFVLCYVGLFSFIPYQCI